MTIRQHTANRSFVHAEYPFDSYLLDLNIDGGEMRMHFLDEGPRNGSVVLMLHGNPTWSFFYRNVVAALRSDLRCIVPDHIGSGLSDKPQDYSYRLADHIDNLEILLDELGIKKFSLVVHDWGGAIGMGLATRRPDCVEKITVMNTAAFPSEFIPGRIAVCRIPLLGKLIIRGCNGFAWPATFMAVEKPLSKAVRDGFLFPYDSWKNRVGNYQFVQDIPMSPGHPSWPELNRIAGSLKKLADKPMLICWGGKDWCFNDTFFHEWEKRFPEAIVKYYADVGHYLLEDAGSQIISEITDFLL